MTDDEIPTLELLRYRYVLLLIEKARGATPGDAPALYGRIERVIELMDSPSPDKVADR